MPENIKTHIDRLAKLRDKLQRQAHAINDSNNGKTSTEEIQLLNKWGDVKDVIQELEFLNDAIDNAQETIKKGSEAKHIIDTLKERLERDLVKVDKKVKSALRIEKKAAETLIEQVEKKEEPVKEKKQLVAEQAEKKITAKAESAAKNINEKKNEAVNSIKSKIDEMGSSANSIWIKSIEEIFDIKDGKIVGDKNFIKQLNRLTVDVLDLLQKEPKFTGAVSGFVKRMQPISEAITDFQKVQNDIKVPAFETAKKIVIDEIVDKMLNNGLNQHFVQPLRDLVYQNVSGGLSLKDARTQIKEYINGGKDTTGKLGRYVEQTAQQAVDGYSGAINAKLLETFDYDGQLITGTLIDNSSPQCRYAIEVLKGKISREDWPKVEAIGKKFNGWIEGTTFDNLPSNKLHWGCRHGFYPIILKKSA